MSHSHFEGGFLFSNLSECKIYGIKNKPEIFESMIINSYANIIILSCERLINTEFCTRFLEHSYSIINI